MEKEITVLFDTILALRTRSEAKNFFEDLLTPAELKEFANRWKTARLLSQKVSYDQIVKETHMSTTTIARISKWLTKGRGGYKTMIKRIVTQANHHNRSEAA